MPLKPGKSNIGANIRELEQPSERAPHGRTHEQALAIALRVAGAPKRATGGAVPKPSRLTSPHVAGIPKAGGLAAGPKLPKLPGIAKMGAMAGAIKVPKAPKPPKLQTGGPVRGATDGREDKVNTSVSDGSHILAADVVSALGSGNTERGYAVLDKMFKPKLETGGRYSLSHGSEKVKVKLSHGEYSVSPGMVAQVGGGDPERGHRALNAFQMQVRRDNIAKLKSLPGPVA